jgi:hypothetical protein
VPNQYVLDLARKHPEFLPAVSIHPARRDALEELERCIEQGAVMMKCLPNCQMIDCRDRRLRNSGSEWLKPAFSSSPTRAGNTHCKVLRADLADPRTLQRPLECGVTVIAAHSAGKSGFSDPEYFDYFVE